MFETVPDTLTVLPNATMFRAARWSHRVCLGVAAIAIAFGAAPLLGMRASASAVAIGRGELPLIITGLWCALSLFLSEPEREAAGFVYARRIAKLLALLSAAVVVFWMRAAASGVTPEGIVFPAAPIALGFVLLTAGVVLLDKRNWLVNRTVDVLAGVLCLVALLMISNAMFGWFAFFGRGSAAQTPAAVVVCFAALATALTLRQSEHGVFSIFLGIGMGSRFARIFAPILLFLPFACEAVRAGLSHGAATGRLAAAIFASEAVVVAVGVLMFFAWRISGMENEIHDLILRDDATRLYNQKGFHMLAEHALRLAQRSGLHFSVLFIELENLSEIHAQFGPAAAATSMAEAGEILRASFRESDIKGRIGAAEFAVAGQFDRAGISVAAMRLEAATASRIAKRSGPVPLRFCMGHVTTSELNESETLKSMLDRASQVRFQQSMQLKEMLVN
jgi:diguanylate cyclase (GGDEF)-like protein